MDTYQSYLAQYPQGEHAREARFQIKELKRASAAPLPVGRYAAYGGGALALLLAIWLVPKMWGGEKVAATPSSALQNDTAKISSVPIIPVADTIDVISYPMVPVTDGTFLMGSPESEKDRSDNECQHSVTVGSFSMGKYEVTQAQWKAIMGNNPSKNKGCDDCPVEQVSWNDIQQFLQKLNTATSKSYRLPTEAEWEYAARGGIKSEKYLYSGSNNLGSVAWYDENAGNKTHIVGSKEANELGLYDMSGNVWEWCQENYGPYPGCSGTANTYRVLRGGSWGRGAQDCRVADRNGYAPENRNFYIGFRLALSPQLGGLHIPAFY